MHENHIVVLHIIHTGVVFQLLGMTMCSVLYTLRCRLEYIILLKLPIILPGNSFLFTYYSPNYSQIFLGALSGIVKV